LIGGKEIAMNKSRTERSALAMSFLAAGVALFHDHSPPNALPE
jgi:hypothetical protein